MNIKWPNIKYKQTLLVTVLGVFVVVLISFVERKIATTTFEEVRIIIDNQYDNYFLHESDVLSMLSSNGLPVTGSSYSNVELKNIEAVVKKNNFVSSVQVHKDLKGALTINITQKRPLARIVQEKGPSAYISDAGDLLPMSERYTARVVMLTGAGAVQMINNRESTAEMRMNLLGVLNYIEEDPFWKAQIAQIDMDSKSELTFYTQVSKQYIQFGEIEDIEEKFDKLRIFYKQILPQKGWNKYKRVDLRFKDQIVCE